MMDMGNFMWSRLNTITIQVRNEVCFWQQVNKRASNIAFIRVVLPHFSRTSFDGTTAPQKNRPTNHNHHNVQTTTQQATYENLHGNDSTPAAIIRRLPLLEFTECKTPKAQKEQQASPNETEPPKHELSGHYQQQQQHQLRSNEQQLRTYNNFFSNRCRHIVLLSPIPRGQARCSKTTKNLERNPSTKAMWKWRGNIGIDSSETFI